MTRAVIRRGHWEPEETREFVRFIRAGAFVIDAGANFGHYTFAAAQLVGPAGLVIGFEPHPNVFKLLAANAALQNCTNIIVEQAGLGSESGVLEITTDLGNPGGHSFVHHNVRQRGAACAVAVHTIDAYLRQAGLADRPINLIKIDVQGFEAKVIAGAAATNARHRPVVLCEVTPAALAQAGDSLETLLAFFRTMDYVASPIGAGDGVCRPLGYDRLTALLEPAGESIGICYSSRASARRLCERCQSRPKPRGGAIPLGTIRRERVRHVIVRASLGGALLRDIDDQGANPYVHSMNSLTPTPFAVFVSSPSEAGAKGRIILDVLKAVEENSGVTQRSLARDLGIALELANAYLKRCVTKGYIKVTHAPAKRYVYYLTPQGFPRKAG